MDGSLLKFGGVGKGTEVFFRVFIQHFFLR